MNKQLWDNYQTPKKALTLLTAEKKVVCMDNNKASTTCLVIHGNIALD